MKSLLVLMRKLPKPIFKSVVLGLLSGLPSFGGNTLTALVLPSYTSPFLSQSKSDYLQYKQLPGAGELCEQYFRQAVGEASAGAGYASSSSMMIFQCSMVLPREVVQLRTLTVNQAYAQALCIRYTNESNSTPFNAAYISIATFQCGLARQYESQIIQLQLQMMQ